MSAVTLQVAPRRTRVDDSLSVRIEGLTPYAPADLVVTTTDGALRVWTSRSAFRADSEGVIDLTRDAPLTGSSYAGVDPTGPLWSVVGDGTALFRKQRATPLQYRFAVELGTAGEVAVVDAVVRHFGHRVVEESVAEPGIVGTVHRPGDRQPRPAVLLLGGSDGGSLNHAASLLADEGYVVLALAYFGVEDRPPTLAGIDLDDIDGAVSWLLARPDVTGAQIAAVGISRGAELALQLASDNPRVGAVVAVAPSALRQPGLTTNFSDFTHAAWVRGAVPLPFNGSKLGMRDWLGSAWGMLRRRPMRQVESFREDLRHPDRVRRAGIAVERCTGPLLLVSGEDDQLWPSAEFADLILARLHAHGRVELAEDLRYARVGHFVAFPMGIPGMPPSIDLSPTSFFSIDFGGERAEHAAAAVNAWVRQLDFLDRWRSGLDPAPPALDGLPMSTAMLDDLHPAPAGVSGAAERRTR
ncbi:acyl-CoA thioesterase/bile acid-CoA:amino acid N-acyltransferase family protein [Ornithinimicrobium ciconiae]|uniref:acyl-CoA thioesterase/bile acid-CoA:amino acid N-acyltransferase family protein n=1 Tax=Ornithinimicrobium ciconiae TaxID=2594265 RepID=UPI0013FD0B95|nr:acyl-CoA thioesterase/bile acid-CoA:amino acid N-acyltransferase family protein [Ornithinimicrobium ciconiae]